MDFMSKEAKVGIFVLIGIIILAYFTLKVGKIEVTEKGYTIYAIFDTISGLDEKSVVKMAGVPVGQVVGIDLVEGKVKVSMNIKETVNIPVDSSISLAAEGLLGEKHIEIYPGKDKEKFIRSGEAIEKSISGADIDELIRKVTLIADDFKKITESLTRALGEERIGRIFDNIDRITTDLGEVTGESKQDMKVLISNLREFTDTLKDKTPEIASKLERTMSEVEGLVTENRENINEAIENIKSASKKLDTTLEKIERGEGTIGKLVTDEKAYEDFSSAMDGINRQIKKLESLQTFLSYKMEFLQEPSEFKHYASIKIQPTVDKYYLFGIVDDPLGEVDTTRSIVTQTPPGTTVETERTEIDDDIKFNALIAKRFGDFSFRGGLMESSGGFGFSYATLSDRLVFNFDLFDFDRENNDPHMKFYGNYTFFKNLFLTAGYDDFINENNDLRTIFFGFGLELRDEDLKTLLRSTPPVTP